MVSYLHKPERPIVAFGNDASYPLHPTPHPMLSDLGNDCFVDELHLRCLMDHFAYRGGQYGR